MKKENSEFHLVKEMFETVDVIKNFKAPGIERALKSLKETGKLFLTGEGSSRIFPAKNIIEQSLEKGLDLHIVTEGARQASEYDLESFSVFGTSNSGRTKEVKELFKKLKNNKFALTTFENTPLGDNATESFILNCGNEEATAATKSVVEQALFYQNLLAHFNGASISQEELNELSEKSLTVLEQSLDQGIIEKICNAETIYFSGRNNGVAEEVTLKTNEITRKKSDYLEGTYAVHGIEEVMTDRDIVILIEPFAIEEEKIKEVLVDGVGLTVISISSRDTIFPTIKIPSMEGFDNYLQLMICWNIMVEVGLKLEVNIDKAERARKVGNEV